VPLGSTLVAALGIQEGVGLDKIQPL
jgi:hypothetical protein